jgi:hypothetical protein
MTAVNKVKSLAARATMAHDDVRALLEKDHDEAKELLERIFSADQSRRRMSLLMQLKTALTAHSRAEENAVYERMLKTKSSDSQELADEGYVEHRIVDHLLAELAGGDSGSTRWLATAKVLKELVHHHIDEEQTDTFAELGEHFDADQLATMGTAFLRTKAAILERQATGPSAGRKARKAPVHSLRKMPAKKAVKAGSRRKPSSRRIRSTGT